MARGEEVIAHTGERAACEHGILHEYCLDCSFLIPGTDHSKWRGQEVRIAHTRFVVALLAALGVIVVGLVVLTRCTITPNGAWLVGGFLIWAGFHFARTGMAVHRSRLARLLGGEL